MKKVIAIDLGGTNLRCAIVDESLNILKAIREKSIHNDEDSLYEQISRILKELLKTEAANDITDAGISCAGFCSEGEIKYSPNLHISNLKLVDKLKKDFPKLKNVVLANDANASSLMEAKFGAGSNDETVLFVTISSGIECGLVKDKKLVDFPFEVGHNYVFYKGRYYELEQLCSGTGIINLAKINGLKIDSASELFSLVYNKDINARKIYEDWLKITGSFLANLQLDFDADKIVLSGGVMRSKDAFYSDLLSVANAFVAPFPCKKIHFAESKFDQDTGLIGGACLVL